MKLIDKDALVAEIERQQRRCDILRQSNDVELRKTAAIQNGVYCYILSFLNTLEVKEVDLEKEMDKFFDEHDVEFCRDEYLEYAEHFFELGLKAQQISEEIKIGETQIYLNDDGGEPPYDGKQWLDISCTEYEIPEDKFKDGDNVEIIIRKTQKGE